MIDALVKIGSDVMFWLKLDWIDGSDSYILSQIGTLSSIQKKHFFFLLII